MQSPGTHKSVWGLFLNKHEKILVFSTFFSTFVENTRFLAFCG
nr:MAG TPA: hypothetical protein [Caudoviricetes sp.]